MLEVMLTRLFLFGIMEYRVLAGCALSPRGWENVVDKVELQILAVSSSSPSPSVFGYLKNLSTHRKYLCPKMCA